MKLSAEPKKIVARPLKFPHKLQFLFKPKRYKVLHGGRGGAKSWGVARALIVRASKAPILILCAREYQNSIAESVHRLLSNQISEMGMDHLFDITDKSIKGKNGSEFIFAGLHNNVKSIKSMEGVDICWVEEAEKVSNNSWEILIPTIRKEGSEIWVTFNPDEESDPTYQRFVVNTPPDAEVVEINWADNKWFPENLRKEKDYLYRVDAEAAEHVWGGKCNTRSDAQIFAKKYVVEAFTPHENWNGPYFGQDFGFGTDPSATCKLWLYENVLYVEYVKFGYGLKNTELDKLIRSIPGAGDHIIRGDNSRPETIAHLTEDFDLKMISCKKWSGCVEDGIQYLRSLEKIVIAPDNKQMIDEARLYRYKVDKVTGDVLPIIVDKHNHGWDSIRYAMEPAILLFHEEVIVVDGAPDQNPITQELDEVDFGEIQFY
jgi:phage terminase large subunit